MKTVAILEGWTEGPATFNKLKLYLTRAGFQITPNTKICTVLIAHSAGSFFIPSDFKGQLVVMINPAYAMSISSAFRKYHVIALHAPKQIRQWGLATWLKLRLLNAFYLMFNFPRTILVVKLLRRDDIPLPKTAKIILLDNKDDIDHKEFFRRVKQIRPAAKYIELPGLHEDCLVNPQPYIDLILKEL